MANSNWLATPDASSALGISPITLKRRRDSHGGFLEHGKHWRFKTDNSNSPMLWEVQLIRNEFEKRSWRACVVFKQEMHEHRFCGTSANPS